MSATGTWVVPTRALEASLGELHRWRRQASQELTDFRRWAVVGRALDDHNAARLAYLERRLLADRLTIAFVAEYSRGKSELINALFFADLGARLLPAGVGRTTLCPTEILWDPSRPPSIRLLPIETRESPQALREFIASPEGWIEHALDPSNPEAMGAVCEAISESRRVSAAEAANLGLSNEESGEADIPRWRYAIINVPHPMLESGLVILDTPGHNTIGAEPEITIHRLPEAAAIVYMLGADTGVTRSDRELWNDHLASIPDIHRSCYVVLNKIDGLRDGFKPESQILAEIDRQVKSTAEYLGVHTNRVFPLSAKQGLLAKIQGDRDGLIRSRIYRLEQALARDMVRTRKLDHAAAVRAESRSAFSEARALIESRLAFTREQLEEIGAIQTKNQKLIESLAKRAASERARLEQARALMMGLRTAYNRESERLGRLLDPASARNAGVMTREKVMHTRFSRQIGEALDVYFRECRGRIREAVEALGEVRAMMEMAARRFGAECQVATVEVVDFATERFVVELDRLEAFCARDFKGAGSLLTRRRSTLGALFFDTVALKMVHLFEIADREVRTWMMVFLRSLESQLNAYQDRANARVEGMGRIQDAESDLGERVDELRRLIAEVAGQVDRAEEHRRRLMGLLEVEEELPGVASR